MQKFCIKGDQCKKFALTEDVFVEPVDRAESIYSWCRHSGALIASIPWRASRKKR